jgi:cell division protein FtsB
VGGFSRLLVEKRKRSCLLSRVTVTLVLFLCGALSAQNVVAQLESTQEDSQAAKLREHPQEATAALERANK